MNDISIWIEGHPGLASWVQAAGAIIGIAVAIFVPWWQHRKDLARDMLQRQTDEEEFLSAVYGIVENAKDLITDGASRLQMPAGPASDGYLSDPKSIDHLVATEEAIKTVPLYRLGNQDRVTAVHTLRMALGDMIRYVREAKNLGSGATTPALAKAVIALAETAKSAELLYRNMT